MDLVWWAGASKLALPTLQEMCELMGREDRGGGAGEAGERETADHRRSPGARVLGPAEPPPPPARSARALQRRLAQRRDRWQPIGRVAAHRRGAELRHLVVRRQLGALVPGRQRVV